MMQCEVIQDLIPLYLDDCCSEKSRRLVEEHLRECDECRKLIQKMGQKLPFEEEEAVEIIREEELFRQSKEVIKKEVKTDYMAKAVRIDLFLNIGLILYLLYRCIQAIRSGYYYTSPFYWDYGKDIAASGIDWACILVLSLWEFWEIKFLKDNKWGKAGGVAHAVSVISVLFKICAIFLCGIAYLAIWMAK